MFPQRPPEHDLETLSERAFAAIIPASWLMRKQDSTEYGIDAEVEIFREGFATGMTFKIQFKGSNRDPDGRRAQQIRLSTLTYWNSLDVPVLVVYYAAATSQLYGAWAHAHRLRLKKKPTLKTTTTFNFPDSAILTPEMAASQIERDVESFRTIRRGIVPEELTCTVSSDIRSDLLNLVLLKLRSIADRGHVRIQPTSQDGAFFRINITRDGVRIASPVEMSSVTMHTHYNFADDIGQAMLAADLIVGMGINLAALGSQSRAADLFIVAGPASPALHIYSVAMTVAVCLEGERRYIEAYELGRPLFLADDPTSRDSGSHLVETARRNVPITNENGPSYVELSQQRIAIELSDGLQVRAGREYYNLAQMHRIQHQYDLAVQALDAASEHDPGYLTRDYFYTERGGLYWILDRPDDAAEDYRKALDLGAEHTEVVPLLADALLSSGRYADANTVLAEWEYSDSRLDRLAAVVRLVADLVLRTTGLERQSRRDLSPDEIERIGEPPDPQVCRQLIEEVDALHARLWLEAADLIPSEDQAATTVLIAHTQNGVPGAWALATLIAWADTQLSDQVRYIIDEGYFRTGDDYVDAMGRLYGEVAEREGEDSADRLRELVTGRVALAPQRHRRTIARIVDPPWSAPSATSSGNDDESSQDAEDVASGSAW